MNFLTSTSPRAEQPNGCHLLNHQLASFYRCQELETGIIKLSEHQSFQTSVGVLADKPGSGKSFIVLALISSPNKIPQQKNNYSNASSSITIIHTEKVNYCDTNAIIVHPRNIDQWLSYMQFFPHLNVMTLRTMNDYYRLIDESDMSMTLDPLITNIVLCSAYLHNYFSSYIERKKIKLSRVFYDDADTLNIRSCYRMDAAFHWFVTASYNNIIWPLGQQKYNEKLSRFVVCAEGIQGTGYIKNFFSRIQHTLVLNNIIVLNHPDFVDFSLGLLEPWSKIVLCKTPKTIQILGETLDAHIAQCINLDDMATAISLYRPNTEHNIIGICIEQLNISLCLLDEQKEYVENEHRYLSTERRTQILESFQFKEREIKEKISAIKERVCAHDGCLICYGTIETKAVVPCCSRAYCMKCIGTWLSRSNTCPMCKATLALSNLLVVTEPVSETNSTETDTSSIIDENNDKICNVLNIIKEGGTIKKILLFSEYPTMFSHVLHFLDKKSTHSCWLKGNVKQVNIALKNYSDPTRTSIMYMSPSYYGSGMNLEMTTDIIFLNKFDNDIEKQIIGRAQRLGRKTQLRIWYLLNKKEV